MTVLKSKGRRNQLLLLAVSFAYPLREAVPMNRRVHPSVRLAVRRLWRRHLGWKWEGGNLL